MEDVPPPKLGSKIGDPPTLQKARKSQRESKRASQRETEHDQTGANPAVGQPREAHQTPQGSTQTNGGPSAMSQPQRPTIQHRDKQQNRRGNRPRDQQRGPRDQQGDPGTSKGTQGPIRHKGKHKSNGTNQTGTGHERQRGTEQTNDP